MKAVKALTQNSPEWHEWRKGGLGASEANIIMGVSEFMTPRMLWKEKLSDEPKIEDTNFIQEKGHKLEKKLRPMFEMDMDNDFPDTIAVHSGLPWLRASLDGYCEETGEIWECKFVGQEDFEKVKNGQVLEKYFPQLQHQMMVVGAKNNHLHVISDDKEAKEAGSKWPYKECRIEVSADLEYQQKELFPALEKFWKMVNDKVEPKISKLDFLELSEDRDLYVNLCKLKVLKEELEEKEKEKKELEAAIFASAKHTKNICKGIKITKSKSEDKLVCNFEAYAKAVTKLEGEPLLNFMKNSEYTKTTKGRTTKRITYPKES